MFWIRERETRRGCCGWAERKVVERERGGGRKRDRVIVLRAH